MKISACIITKNEADNIETCVRSCLKIADEVIVADTGSTDDTVSKAKALGARVYAFTWIDDFAAAKNYALSKATGEWVFFPDADEYIDDETAFLFMEEIKKNKKTNIEAITAIIYNIDKLTGDVQKGVEITRLFKNTGEIFYSGKIHEKLAHKTRQPVHTVLHKARIYHTGYTEALLPQKHERNLRLLLAVEKEGNADTINLYHIAGVLFSLGRYDEAMTYIERIEKSPDFSFLVKHFSLMPNFFAVKVQTMSMLEGRYAYEEITDVIRQGIAYYPEDYRLSEQKLNLELFFGRYDEAMKDYQRTIALYDQAEEHTGFSHKRDRSRMLAGIARIFLLKRQKEKAFDYYVQAVVMDYTFGIALIGLLDILRDQPTDEIIAFLKRIYDEEIPEQKGFLTFITGSAIMPEVFSYYYRGLHDDQSIKFMRYQVYAALFSEAYDHAVQIAKRLLEEEKNTEKIKELQVLCGVCEVLKQYNNSSTIPKGKVDEHYIGILEILLKLNHIQAAESFLDWIQPGDKDTLLAVAELMKNIGYYDAATDFYHMLDETCNNEQNNDKMQKIKLAVQEGLAFCAFQKDEWDEAKQRYQDIKCECKAAAQFLKWMEESSC